MKQQQQLIHIEKNLVLFATFSFTFTSHDRCMAVFLCDDARQSQFFFCCCFCVCCFGRSLGLYRMRNLRRHYNIIKVNYIRSMYALYTHVIINVPLYIHNSMQAYYIHTYSVIHMYVCSRILNISTNQ